MQRTPLARRFQAGRPYVVSLPRLFAAVRDQGADVQRQLGKPVVGTVRLLLHKNGSPLGTRASLRCQLVDAAVTIRFTLSRDGNDPTHALNVSTL